MYEGDMNGDYSYDKPMSDYDYSTDAAYEYKEAGDYSISRCIKEYKIF